MKIFKAEQVKEADNYTITNEPISSIDLMERAALNCTKKIRKIGKKKQTINIFVGPGNNGGDGLAIARNLHQKRYSIKVFILNFTKNYSQDFTENLNRLRKLNFENIFTIEKSESFPQIKKSEIIIDAIFGSGLSRNIEGLPKDIILLLNKCKATKIAIDIPSGLFGEENKHLNQIIFKADYTLTFEYPFLSFFFPENERFVGRFNIIKIGVHPNYIKKTKTNFYYTEKKNIKIKKRTKFSHKGTFGHSLIIAGSYEKAGAAILSIKAAHRIGAGLVTALVPKCNYQITHITSPETMLKIDSSEYFISKLPELKPYNSIAIGPGISFNDLTIEMLKNLCINYNKPIIFDADAITIIAKNNDLLNIIPENSIFTPHPKEFERLVGVETNNYKRLQLQVNFSKKYKCYIVLKGANTCISTPNGKCYFNSTGNPGMATGGSGDVLTGIISGLIAQNYTPKQACKIGVFLHGLAGDIAIKKTGENSLIASDIIDFLPKAFFKIENK